MLRTTSHRLFNCLMAGVAAACFSGSAAAQLVDYGGYRPQYQGFGVNTPAGRGGSVCRVTSLSDAYDPAAGTLRSCIAGTGPRIVIFEISGTIVLTGGPLTIKNPYLTIAGQTAPSPGITIRGQGLIVDTHDVVVQHLRIRVGNVREEPVGLWIRDDANNVVADHVSVSWGVWDGVAIGAYRSGHPQGDVTIIDSIVAESLACSGVNSAVPCNPSTYPGRGSSNSRAIAIGDSWRNSVPRVSLIRNISANSNDRHPEIGGNTQTVLVNNLIYNPSLTPLAAILFEDANGQGPSFSLIKGNVLLAGPTTPGYNGYRPLEYREEGDAHLLRIDATVDPRSRVYLEGNYYEKDCGGTQCLASATAQWMLAKDYKMDWQRVNIRATAPPLELSNLPLSSALAYTDVEGYVKRNAGARPLDRDVVDARIVGEISARTGSVPNNTSEKAGPGTDPDGFPVLAVNRRSLQVPSNPNGVADSVGRTRIEVWLESLARQLEPGR